MKLRKDTAIKTTRRFSFAALRQANLIAAALMDGAKNNGWTVISMKNDWKWIFAFEQ